jgi:hypothetical protein
VLDVYNDFGTAHDFKMFKESLESALPKGIFAMVDSGYQGIKEYLPNAFIPYKANKSVPLTNAQKAFNTQLSSFRVKIEHIIRSLKIFRICKETYRGKGKRGLIRGRLIAALYNHNDDA